jgi:hypothetical protein
MKITAKTETYVSTKWGTAITVLPGEVREVGDDLGYECIQAGCTEVRYEPKPEPKPKPKPKTTPKKTSAKKAKKDITIEV